MGKVSYEILDEEDKEVERTSPVFLDASGRRRRWLQLAGYGMAGVCAMYTVVVAASLMGGPVNPDSLLPWPESGTAAKKVSPSPSRSVPMVARVAPTTSRPRSEPMVPAAPSPTGKRKVSAPATSSRAPSSPRATSPAPTPSEVTRTPDPEAERRPAEDGGGLLGLLGIG